MNVSSKLANENHKQNPKTNANDALINMKFPRTDRHFTVFAFNRSMRNKFDQFLVIQSTHFFISNTLIRNTRLKLAKNQVNGKRHPEAELSLFENYSLLSSM